MLKVSGNHPCICESEEKYKKCCKGKLSQKQEEYFAYLQKNNILRNKIVNTLSYIILEDELNECIKKYLHIIGQDELESNDELGLIEWLLFDYDKFENKTILEYIYDEMEDKLDEIQKEIFTGLLQSQRGVFEVISINREFWEIKIREIFLQEEYIVTDRLMSMQLNVSNYILSRISQKFSFTVVGDHTMIIPDIRKRYILDEITSCFEKKKLETPDLTYKEFMNSNFEEINNCINSPPKIGAINGDEISFHTQELIIKTINIENILEFYNSINKFKIINFEYDEKIKTLLRAEIVYLYDESDNLGNSNFSTRLVTHAFNNDNEQIPIFGSYIIEKNILTITSPTTAQFQYLSKLFEEHFGDEIIEKKKLRLVVMMTY